MSQNGFFFQKNNDHFQFQNTILNIFLLIRDVNFVSLDLLTSKLWNQTNVQNKKNHRHSENCVEKYLMSN